MPEVPITGLKFDKEDTTIITAGGTDTAIVTPTPVNATTPDTITFTSSDSDVATVVADSANPYKCTITAVADGTATITATAGNVSTTLSVTVDIGE